MAGATVRLAELPAWLEGYAKRVALGSYERALKQCGVAVAAAAKESFANAVAPDSTPWKPLGRARPRGGSKPLRDRGLLMASVTGRGRGFFQQITPTRLEQGTNLEYAALHAYGGTIVPRKAKMLAVPLTKDAAKVEGPRQFPRKLFVMKAKTGTLFLAELKGKKKKLTLHFLLKKSVTVPARPFLGWSQKLLETVEGIVAAEAERKAKEQ